MKPRKFCAILSLMILSLGTMIAQPTWVSNPAVSNLTAINCNLSFQLNVASNVYTVVYLGDYTYLNSGQVKSASGSGTIPQRPYVSQLFNVSGPQTLLITGLLPNKTYTILIVGESGGKLQNFPFVIYPLLTPACPAINILTGFSQIYTCYTTDPARIPTARIAVVLDDPPNSGILKGTTWVFKWGDGDTTTFISAANYDIPSSAFRSHPYPAKTSCNYSIELTVTNPCGQTRKIGYTAVVHGRDIPDDGNGILSIVNNATGSSVVQVCEGSQTIITLRDNSTWNCQGVALPNSDPRNIEWLYGQDPSGGSKNTITGTVLVGGLSAPQSSGRITPAPYGPTSLSQAITIPATAKANEYFRVYLKNWNKCNPGDLEYVSTFIDIQVVSAPPSPTAPSRTVCLTDDKTLTVTSVPTGTITWYRNSALTIPLGTGPTYVATETTAGTYYYYVTDKQTSGLLCQSPATTVTLIINPKPSTPTLTYPSKNDICYGVEPPESYTIKASASSSPPITGYQWYRDGVLLPGRTYDTIIIRRPDETGSYTARSVGAASSYCYSDPSVAQYVTVHTLLNVKQPVDQTICENQNAVFRANTTEEIANWQWEYSSNGGVTFSTVGASAPYSGFNDSVLTITTPPVVPYSGYYYRVEMKTPNGQGGCRFKSSKALLTINGLPTANAGPLIKRCSSTPLDPIYMTGATRGGSFSAVVWSGGETMGSWTQNANPALAYFTPSVNSGAFTATLTVTGTAACGGVIATSSRNVSWSKTPTAEAGTDISRCDASPTSPFTMTGASAGGTYSGFNWTGGTTAPVLGTWTQHPTDPALAVFTPSVPNGSFAAILTVSGDGACAGTNPSDSRIISWGQIPVAVPGPDLSRCDGSPNAPFTMTGAASSGTFNNQLWSGGEAMGTWTQNTNPALAVFTPSVNSGSFDALLSLTGSGACTGTNVSVSRKITWSYATTVSAGPDQSICATASVTLAGSITGGVTTGTWSGGTGIYNPNNTTLNAIYTPSAAEKAANSVTLTLTSDDPPGICPISSDDITISIGTLPTMASVTSPNDACFGDGPSYMNLVITGGAPPYTISYKLDGVVKPNITNYVSGTNTSIGTLAIGLHILEITQIKDGCNNFLPGASLPGPRNFTIFQKPVASAGSDKGVCNALVTNLKATRSVGTGTWSQISGPGTISFSPDINSDAVTATASDYGTYVVRWTEVNGVCTSYSEISVSYERLAAAGVSQNHCGTLSATLAGNTPASGTGTWTKFSGPVGSTVSFSPNANTPGAVATVSAYGTYVLRWTIANNIFCSTSSDVTITFEKTANAGAEQHLCGTLAATMAGNTPSVGTGTWSLVNGPAGGTVSFTPNINTPGATATVNKYGTYVFNWKIENGAFCSSNQDVSITYNPTGQVDQPASQILCHNAITSAINFTTTNTGGTTTYNWTNSATTIGLLATGTGDIASFTAVNTGTAPVVASIVVVPVYSDGTVNCTGPSKTFTITVYPAGQVNKPADQVVCHNALTAPVNFTTINTGKPTNYSWSNSAPSIGLDASGIGNIPAFTALNTGNAPVTATVTILPTFSDGTVNCSGATEKFTITVNPAGEVTQPSNMVICNASKDTVKFTTANTVGSTSYSWTNTNTAIGLAATGSGDIIFTGTNTTTAPISGTIEVTPTFTYGGRSCDGPKKTFTITVNPAGKVNQPANVVICNGDPGSVTFTTNNSVGTTSYYWTNNNATIGLGDDGTGTISFIAVNSGTAPVSATITVTPTFNFGSTDCTGPSKTFTITVNPTPKLTSPLTPPGICSNSTFTYNPSSLTAGTTFNWERAVVAGIFPAGPAFGTNDPNEILRDTTNIQIAVTYKYTLEAGGCTNTQNVIVNVKPEPVILPGQTSDICSGNTTNYHINLQNFINPIDNVTFTWPAPVLNPNNPSFMGGTERSSASATNIADVYTNTMGVNGTATYTVTPYKNGCQGASEDIEMTIRSQPVLDGTLNKTVCSNTPVGLLLKEAAGSVVADYYNISKVTLDAGLSADTLNATISNPAAPFDYLKNDKYINITGVNKNVTYRIQPVHDPDCYGAPVDVVITIRPQPYIVPAQTKTVCSGVAIGKEILLSPANIPVGTIFNWPVPTMTDASGQGTAGLNVTAEPAGKLHINDVINNFSTAPIQATYFITPTSSAGCNGTEIPVVITINPEPIPMPISGRDKICINEKNIVYGIPSVPGSTFHWSDPLDPAIGVKTFDFNTNAIIVDAAAVPGSGNITVYETNSYICNGDPSTLFVQVFAQASPEDISGLNNICANSTQVYSVNSRAGSVYSWTIPGGAAIIGDPAAASVTVIFGNVGGVISVKETNIAGCVTNHKPLTVVVKPLPTAIINGGGTICDGGSMSLFVDFTGTGPYVFTYAINGISLAPVSTSSDPYTLPAIQAGTYTIVNVSDATGCTNIGFGSSLVTYFLKPTGIISGGTTMCGGATTTLTMTFMGKAPYTFSYYDGVTTFSVPNWPDPVYTASVSPAVSTTYTLTSLTDGNGCTGLLSGSAVVTINSPPALTITKNNLTCNNDYSGAVDLTVTGNNPFGISWSGPGGYVANTEDISGLKAGTYTVTVTDTKGCISTGSATLTEPGAVNAAVSSTNIVCFGAANGSITISSASGGSGVYEYSIDGGINWAGTGTFTGLVPGNYDVRIRDIAAPVCNKILNPALSVTGPAILNATVIHSDIICYGANNGSITISNPSGGFGTYEYSVDGGSNWQGSGNFTALLPGTYHVWIRDAAHPLCVVVLESPLEITAPPLLSATVNSTNISCFGSTDGTISISAPSGGHGTFEYSINGGGSWQSSGLYTNLAPGTYNVQIRDEAYTSCYRVLDGMLTITQPAVLRATVSSSMVTCNSKNDGTISITAPSGGSGSYLYTINGGFSWEISGLYTNLAPGSYDVRIKDAASISCEIILNNGLLITEPSALSASVIKTNITCNGADDGTIIITNSLGGYGTFEYSIDGGFGWQPSNSFLNLSAGTHSVWIRDRVKTTCSLLLDPAIVITEPAPLAASLDSTNVSCFNANNGTITISAAAGGSGAYQYSINGGGTWFGSGNFINLGPGSYNVIMRDAANIGCFITLDPALVLSEPAALGASLSSTNVTCFGLSDGTITISNPLGGSGSYEYTINGGSTWQLSGSYTGLISGNYNVQIRDVLHPACATVLNNSLSISQPGILYATVSTTMISCYGSNDGIINLAGPSGGYGTYEYSINGGTDWQSSGLFSNLTPDFYDVRIRDASFNTCVIVLKGSLELTQPGAIGASLAYSNITCNGNNDGSITISSPTGGYGTFEYTINGWSTWQASGSFTNLAPGLYNVQIRDRAHTSCVTVLNGTLSLTQPNALTGTATGTNITCNGANNGKITISGSSGGYGTYEYSIDGGVTWQSAPLFTGLIPGSYGVRIRDAAHISCSASLGSISITQPGQLSGSAAGTNVTCAGSGDGTITISSVSGGYGLYEYTMDGGGTWQSSDSFTNLAPGFYNVQMRDASNPGCTKIINSSLRITEPATLNANYTKSDITCNGLTDGRITITIPTGGSGFYEFTITGGAPWQASGTFTGLSAGMYNVQMRDAAHTGCVTILNSSLQITEPAIMNASVTSSDITCNGISDGIITISGATGGYGIYQYSINGGIAWFSSGSFTSLSEGSYDVWMLDASSPACRIQIDPAVIIAEPDPLNATLAKTNVTCFGSGDGTIIISDPLGGYGNYEYTINGGGSWQNSGNFTGLGPGNYNVIMRDADHKACSKMLSSSYNITQPAQLNGVVTTTMVTCNGADDGIINITSPSGGYGLYDYSINGGTDWSGSGLFTNLAPGIYDVKIRDASNIGCVTTLNNALTITEPDALGANLSSTNITCNGADDGTINISFATGGYGTYEYRISGSLWQGTGYFSGLAPATYVVEIRDKAHPACIKVLNPGLVLTEPPVLSATVNSTDVSCFGANDGMITITDPIGGYGTYSYSVNGGSAWQSSGTFANLAPGNYNIQIRDAANPACKLTLNPALSVTQPTVLSASVTGTNVTCFGASDGTITISAAAGGYGTYEYSVNGGTAWQSSGNFTALAPGFYNVQIRDAANIGCVKTLNGSFRITEPGVLAAVVQKTNVTCFGSNNGTITISGATGGYGTWQYTIDGGTSWQASGNYIGLAPGTYNVQIRDAVYKLCVMTLDGALNISEPAVLTASAANTNVSCNSANDATITISGAAGGSGIYQYTVNGGTSWSGINIFSNLAPGSYDVRIKDALTTGCIKVLNPTLTITEPSVLNATISRTDVTCYGSANGTITVSAPSGGYGTYEFSVNGGGSWQSSGSFTALSPGNYNVLMRDATNINCMKVLNASYAITQPGMLTATVAKTDITCNGANNGSITITSPAGGYGTYEYSIDGGISWQSSGNFSSLDAGSYDVRIRDAANITCNAVLFPALIIGEPFVITMTTTGDVVLKCFGDMNGTGTFYASGGTIPYTFSVLSNTTGGITAAPGFNSQSFFAAGTGSITVQVTDAKGCNTQSTITITQPAQLTPGSIETDQVLCSGSNPATITEVVAPTGGPGVYLYQWQYSSALAGPFINIPGATANQYTPSPGATTTLYYRRLVTSGTCAAAVSNIVEILINPLPIAIISGGATICPTQITNLKVDITGGTGPFEIDIENYPGLTISGYVSGTDIPVSPASTTSYRILRVRDANGCQVAIPSLNLIGSATVTLMGLPAIVVSPVNKTVCELGTTSFTVTATGSGITYQWYVNEGSGFNPVTDGGIYFGATSSSLMLFGVTELMNNNVYHVVVTGCSTSVTSGDAILTVNTYPEITVQPHDTTVCLNSNGAFSVTAQGTLITYQWQVNIGAGFVNVTDDAYFTGSANPTLNIINAQPAFNNYIFRMKVTGVCGAPAYSNLVVLRVTMAPVVTVNPVSRSVCDNSGTAAFTGGGSGPIDSLRWQLLIGGIWTDIYDNAIYSGTMSQQLTVNNAPFSYNGNQYRLAFKAACTSSYTNPATLTVNANPIVDFSTIDPLTICGGVATVIDGNPSGGSGTYVQHTWTGDVGPLNDYFIQAPTFRSVIDGTFNLNYKVKDSFGCTSNANLTVNVDAPDATFIADISNGCTPLSVHFTKTMTGISKFWWNFDDGSAVDSVTASPTHVFTNITGQAIDYHDVELKVMSAGGCIATYRTTITIYPDVPATITPSDVIVCSGRQLSFTATPGATKYFWEYGDGVNGYGTNVVTHLYTNLTTTPQVLHVKLTTTSVYNCFNVSTKDITVMPMPVPQFTADPVTQVFNPAGNSVAFTNNTNNGTWTWLWRFGDGATSAVQDPSYTYTGVGEYLVKLIASNANCSDSTSGKVYVTPLPPIADFDSVPNGCTPLEISLNNTSENLLTPGTTVLWDFGDGNTSTQRNPVYIYNTPGIYKITLTVTGPGGTSVKMQIVESYETPTSFFKVSPTYVFANDEAVRCFNLSSNADYYIWEFGDGDTSHVKDPYHKYMEEGVYNITLHAYSLNGCFVSWTLSPAVTVEPAGTLRFSTVFTPNKDGPIDRTDLPTGGTEMDQFFFPPIREKVNDYKLQIFNRWGTLIFESRSINIPWNGYYKGKLCSQGVYVWFVEGKYANGKPFRKTGDVTLLH